MNKVIWYRDTTTLARLIQAAILVVIILAIYYMAGNASQNMDARGVKLNYWFLQTEASFKVGFTPFWNFELGETKYWEVFVIGIQNTILVSVAGIIGATFIGFTIGVARLSDNWFLKKFASVYIEVFRNIPLLLQVFFWYFVVILPNLPSPKNSMALGEYLFINNKGIFTPTVSFTEWWPLAVFAAAIVIALMLIFKMRAWAKSRFMETAQPFPTFLATVAILVTAFAIAYVVSSSSIFVEFPIANKFGFTGGFWIPIPLFSLWLALVIYTGAFIAENVRGGIQSVHGGQTEAAKALGFHPPLSMKLILIPQAMRVIIPPTISQFLNLIKNSSLAIVIGYDDLVNVWMGVSLNQTGQAIVIIAMTMGVFTLLSLLTSLILNLYNNRTQLVER